MSLTEHNAIFRRLDMMVLVPSPYRVACWKFFMLEVYTEICFLAAHKVKFRSMLVYAYTRAHARARVHTHTHTYTHTRTRTHARTHALMYDHTQTHNSTAGGLVLGLSGQRGRLCSVSSQIDHYSSTGTAAFVYLFIFGV